MPNLQPGNYIMVSVTYSYRSMFSDLTVARFFGTLDPKHLLYETALMGQCPGNVWRKMKEE